MTRQYIYYSAALVSFLLLILFIKPLLMISGFIYIAKFAKSNVLFAKDHENFIKNFIGQVDNTPTSGL